jgi:hypothetical protein
MADLCAGRRDARQPEAVSEPHCLAPRAGNRPTGFPTGNLLLSGPSRKIIRTVTHAVVWTPRSGTFVGKESVESFFLKYRRQEIVMKDSNFSINS